LVDKYLNRIIRLNDSRLDNNVLKHEKEIHDQSKFEKPEHEPYIKLTWNYYLKDHGKKINWSSKELKEMQEATFHHVKTNKHHPEAWDKNSTIEAINNKDRDKPSGYIIDATGMPLSYIATMVADWCAVSEEKETDPYKWCEMNINKRWIFTDKQIKLIYDLLNKIWKK
jgi:hypothetical protein